MSIAEAQLNVQDISGARKTTEKRTMMCARSSRLKIGCLPRIMFQAVSFPHSSATRVIYATPPDLHSDLCIAHHNHLSGGGGRVTGEGMNRSAAFERLDLFLVLAFTAELLVRVPIRAFIYALVQT